MECQQLEPEQFTKPTDDYLRLMTASGEVAIADVPSNVANILTYYEQAKHNQAELLVMPELCLTGYSTADLFLNQQVREQAVTGLQELAVATVDGPALAVGVPLEHGGRLFNCAALLANGEVQGVVPKSYLPNYSEFYEKRWFSSGKNVTDQQITIGDTTVPFGVDLHFNINGTTVGMEICEDGWATISPSTYGALGGAEVYVNLSASNELVGKDDFRRNMLGVTAAKALMAYAYTSAGKGESVADVIYGGAQLISENGKLVANRPAHDKTKDSLVYDIDRTELQHDRLVNKTFADQVEEIAAERRYRTIPVTVTKPTDEVLLRDINPHPYVPSNKERLNEVCEGIFNNLATALAQRATDAHSDALVLGLSGGLDSLLALLISMRAAELSGKDVGFIHTVTMPGPASSERTQDNASELANALGTTHQIMPIGNLATDVLTSIGHDKQTEDNTYENAQARVRTLLLMNYANLKHGMVVGTGDMSEISQGWCTYNGDQMSMFNPNAGIPKTLVRHLATWYAERYLTGESLAIVQDILATPISPELTGNGDLEQTTEALIGPYELLDFFDYHQERFGRRATKIGYLARVAFKGVYEADEIAHWMTNYLRRDTANQWKAEAMPNGTKVGTVAKSPRGDRRRAPNTSANWYLPTA